MVLFHSKAEAKSEMFSKRQKFLFDLVVYFQRATICDYVQ
jgi:hypothetical protein